MSTTIRHDWTVEEVEALFELPFADLMFRAQETHRANHEPNAVQMSTLLSIKTGACPEDCAYCPQSVRYDTGLERETLVPLDEVRARAQAAKEAGATRFCMGAAWRSPKKRDLEAVAAMIREVRALGMETCATLGMLKAGQAHELKEAGLDYYNHNVDTSPEFYGEIITTRTYQDRLDTLAAVREAGLNVCCGGIVGMGETDARSRLDAREARQSAAAPGKRADQPARARAGHAARGRRARRSVRVRAHDCRRAHHDAEGNGASVGGPRGMATRCRRCVSSPARTRSSTARSC